MELHPITGAIGAEITGVDLSQVDAPLAAALRAALDQHLVLMIRDQNLDIAAQMRLAEVFGRPIPNPYATGMAECPEMTRIVKEAEDRAGVFGGGWHTDLSFLAEPPAGSVLCGVDVPPYGGDTLFASQQAAWDRLSAPLKAFLDRRRIAHVGKPYGIKWAPPVEEQSMKGSTRRGDPKADRERWHPAVLTHPRTGRRSLYLNPTYALRVEGMSEAESRPLLTELFAQSTRPEVSCRLRWTSGAVAIWSNYATQHYAVDDYAGFRREMRRVAFAAEPLTDWSPAA
ncbi:MAG: TauD/TfdA family dioxygenase [Pseudomonadota bacterium]